MELDLNCQLSEEQLKDLAVAGKLLWKGKKLFFNPFMVVEEGEGDIIHAKEPRWVIRHGTLYFSREKEVVEEKKLIEPLPFLILKDRHGAFADLWMDYGAQGKILYSGSKLERAWEKDLLETGFVKKPMVDSHYYCPLDQVTKSITFLLEVGWKVFDSKNRLVVKKTDETLFCSMENERILMKGKVSYENFEMDLTKVVGAFNRRERFLELGSSHVALLDESAYCELSGGDIINDAVSIKKSHFGILEEFFNKCRVIRDLSVQDLTVQCKEVVPSSAFMGKLYPYQQEGLNWLSFLHKGGLGALLADEMGLGKTVQVLAFISRIVTNKPILIVMPTSLIFNWKNEIEKFLPSFEVYIHRGNERIRQMEELLKKQIILTTYAYLRLDLVLQQIPYSIVVLDEAQYIKNASSQAATYACRLQAEFRLCVTGTPIENSFDDLWSHFHFLVPDLLEEQKALIPHEVKRKIRPFILRRKKEAVLKDLPEKIEQTTYVDMDEGQREMYEKWLYKTKSNLPTKHIEVLEAILRLRQICCHPYLVDGEEAGESGKLNRLMEDLEEIVAQNRKVLVFSQFTQMLGIIKKKIEERGWSYLYLDGSTKNREEVVGQFQNGDFSIFLMSLKAGGVGLNLTAADYVILYDPWWNEAVEQQAIDRAHRLGRSSCIIARRYVTALSIEEKIMNLKGHKSNLSQVLDFEAAAESLTLQDLYNLLA